MVMKDKHYGTAGVRKRLVIFASQKGGVGKTALSMAAVDFVWRVNAAREEAGQERFKVMVADVDGDVEQLSETYGEHVNGVYDVEANEQHPFDGVLRIDFNDERKRDDLFKRMRNGADFIFLDTSAGALSQFASIFGSMEEFKEMAERTGYRITLVMPLPPEKTATASAALLMKEWGGEEVAPSDVDFVAALRWPDPDPKNTDLHAMKGDQRRDAPAFSNWCGKHAGLNGDPQESLLKRGGKEIFHFQIPAGVMEDLTTLAVPVYKALIEFENFAAAARLETHPAHKEFLEGFSEADWIRLRKVVKAQDEEFKKLDWFSDARSRDAAREAEAE